MPLRPCSTLSSSAAVDSSELTAANQLAAAAVQHAREIGDRRAEAAALITLGNGLAGGGDDARASGFAAWTEAAAAARAAGEDWWEACALGNLAEWALRLGDREEAARLCDDLTRLEGGAPNVIITVDLLRAQLALVEGDAVRARREVVRVLERQRGMLFAAGYDEVELAARIVAGDGRLDDAALLMVAATAREADLGLTPPVAWNEPGYRIPPPGSRQSWGPIGSPPPRLAGACSRSTRPSRTRSSSWAAGAPARRFPAVRPGRSR